MTDAERDELLVAIADGIEDLLHNAAVTNGGYKTFPGGGKSEDRLIKLREKREAKG